MTKVKVLIVEDDPVIAEDIREKLLLHEYEITGIAYDYEMAMDGLANDVPDLVLLDINLGGNMDGIEIAKEINIKFHIPFVYLTSYSNKSVIDDAKQTRPMGYIVKPFSQRDLFSTIEIAIYNFRLSHLPKKLDINFINKRILSNLTQKEFEILMDIYEGESNKAISEKHFVSINTIKTHIQRIYDKLDVNSRSTTIAKVRSLLK